MILWYKFWALFNNGWILISSVVMLFLKKEVPPGLVKIKKFDDGRGRVKFTAPGVIVARYL